MFEQIALDAITKAALDLAAPKVANGLGNAFSHDSNLTLLNLVGRSTYTPTDDFPAANIATHFALAQHPNLEANYQCSMFETLNHPRNPRKPQSPLPWYKDCRTPRKAHRVTVYLGLTQAGPQSPNENFRKGLSEIAKAHKADFAYFVSGRSIDNEGIVKLLGEYGHARKIFRVTHLEAIPEAIRRSNITLVDDTDVFHHVRDDLNHFRNFAHYQDATMVSNFTSALNWIWQNSAAWSQAQSTEPNIAA